MQQIWTLRKISLILCLALVTVGCATNKNVTEKGFSVTASGTSDGILLHFGNIPEDTTDISLAFVDINAKDRQTNVVLNYNALDEVKETGNLLCPFAENGREYFIRVYRFTGHEVAEKIVTGAIAGGGIYMTNSPLLHFTNGNKTLALSEMPAFSKEVVFSQDDFFNYYTYVRKDDGSLIGIDGEASNGLICSVSIQPTEDTAKMYTALLTGNLPLYGTAHCLLEYGNLEWLVQVAQSEDVIISF
jgi:hypothetical protein